MTADPPSGQTRVEWADHSESGSEAWVAEPPDTPLVAVVLRSRGAAEQVTASISRGVDQVWTHTFHEEIDVAAARATVERVLRRWLGERPPVTVDLGASAGRLDSQRAELLGALKADPNDFDLRRMYGEMAHHDG